MADIRLNDVGTLFKATIVDENDAIVDISSATIMEFIFLKPNKTTLTTTATLYTDGTDGIMKYATVAGDIDQSGSFKVQGHVVLSTGEWRTSILSFQVGCNL